MAPKNKQLFEKRFYSANRAGNLPHAVASEMGAALARRAESQLARQDLVATPAAALLAPRGAAATAPQLGAACERLRSLFTEASNTHLRDVKRLSDFLEVSLRARCVGARRHGY